MLREVAEGASLEVSAVAIERRYTKSPEGRETAPAIGRALRAPRDGRGETVEILGGGWVAEEALAIALYACLAGRGFEDTLRIAVTHGGDSDSTGATAGNMLGLLYPGELHSHRWTRIIECRDLVERLMADFAALQPSHRGRAVHGT